MTHSAQGPRPGASAQGHLYVQCPTCRKTVTGERAHGHAPSGVRVAHTPGREQFERLTVLGSEPGDRVPRMAFLEHVNMDDGRPIDPARAGGQGRTPRTSSRSRAPETPPPARPPPRPDGIQAIPAPRGSCGQAAGEGFHNGRNGPRGGGAGDPESSGGRSNGNDRERGDRAHGDGPRGGREEEQGEDRLMRGHVTALGEATRRMVDDPTLRQIFFGGYEGAPRVEARAHDADPPALRATRGDEARNTGHGSGGGSRRDRQGRCGDDHRRGEGSGHHGGRDDRPYRHEPYGRDGVDPGRHTASARRAGNAASATSGGEHTGSTHRGRNRGRDNVIRGPRSSRTYQGLRGSSWEHSRSASAEARRNLLRGDVARVVEDRVGAPPQARFNPLRGGVQVVEDREASRRDHGDGQGHAASSGWQGAPEQERARSGRDGPRRSDPPLGQRIPLAAPSAVSSPPRRRPSDAATPTSIRSGGTLSAGRATLRRRSAMFPLRRAPRGLRPPALQGICATPRAGSTAAMTSSGCVRRLARRASSSAGTRTFSSHAETTPPLPPRPCATCAGSTSRIGRARPKAAALNSPRPSPSLGDRARIASAPATHRLLCGHTLDHRARRAWPTRREGSTRPALAPGIPTDRGPLPTTTT